MNGVDAEKALLDASSMPESMVMDVYHSVSAITDSGVSAYLKPTVIGAGAEKSLPDAPSMPELPAMDVYHSVSAITDSGSQRPCRPP